MIYDKSIWDKLSPNLGNFYDGLKPIQKSNCMHDNCPSCRGTGVKSTGGSCIHGISCPCPKCRTYA